MQLQDTVMADEAGASSASLLLPSSGQRSYSVQEAIVPDVDADNGSQVFFYPWEIRTLPRGTSSAFGAVFIVVNAALGAGLLAFPQAFYNAGGVAYGIAIEAILLVFILASLLILAYAAEVKQAPTYEDIVEQVCGSFAKVLAELCVVVFCFGSATAFLVVIGDQTVDITSVRGSLVHYWYVDRRFMITVVSVVFILPWLFAKRIGILSYTSFLAVLCCVYIAVVVTAKYFLVEKDPSELICAQNTTRHQIDINYSHSWTDSLNAIPFICFGFQCHVSAVPVYAGLKSRSVRVFTVVVMAAIFICVSVYTLTGTFGYLTFHSKEYIESDILRNYCPRDIMVDVARGMLGLVMVTSYPILTFCGRTAVDSILLKLLKPCQLTNRIASYEGTRLRVISVVWFFLSLTLALFIPQISYIIDFTGGLAATFIFIFPGLILMKLTLDSTKSHNLLKCVSVSFACLLIVLGSFIFGISFVNTVMTDAHLY